MEQRPQRPPSCTGKLAYFGLTGAAFLSILLLLGREALACGPAMRVLTPGVMFWLVVGWIGAGIISVLFLLIDRKSSQPLSVKNRRRVVLALFAVITLSRLVHYAVTVDVDDWRLFDHDVSRFQPADVNGQVNFD